MYKLAAKLDSPKRVLFSDSHRSAHVILPSRAEAITLYKRLQEEESGGFPAELGGDSASAKLMLSLKPEEIYEAALNYEKHLDRLKEDNFVVDQDVSASLVDKIIRAKCPVVVDFHLHPKFVSMDVFACR